MKFKILIIVLFLSSCASNTTSFKNKLPYNSKGFAYIYNDKDFEDKVISGKLNNSILQVSQKNLKTNALLKIINPKTNDSIVLQNYKKINYPDFYKILITTELSKKLNLDPKLPLVEILEIKKNKSFVAKKAQIFNEEKKLSSNAPVASVEISNISKKRNIKTNKKKDEIYIIIATFYSSKVANFLKQRINKEIPNYDINKLKVRKKSNKEIMLISGPYYTINFLKNDYIQLKAFGFEELDITINE